MAPAFRTTKFRGCCRLSDKDRSHTSWRRAAPVSDCLSCKSHPPARRHVRSQVGVAQGYGGDGHAAAAACPQSHRPSAAAGSGAPSRPRAAADAPAANAHPFRLWLGYALPLRQYTLAKGNDDLFAATCYRDLRRTSVRRRGGQRQHRDVDRAADRRRRNRRADRTLSRRHFMAAATTAASAAY